MLLTNVMENYFLKDNVNESKGNFSPVKVNQSHWNVFKSYLQRTFVFEERKFKEVFVVELLKYSRECDCNIEFSVKKEQVTVTIDAISPYVSEIEIEASKDILKIKKDIMYYYASKD